MDQSNDKSLTYERRMEDILPEENDLAGRISMSNPALGQ